MAVAGRTARAFRAGWVENRRTQSYKQCSCSSRSACGSKVVAKAAARSVDEAQLLSASDDSIDVQQTFGTAADASADVITTVAGSEVVDAGSLEAMGDSEDGRQATSREALFNCVNILLGCGVLSIPYALEEGGWAAFGVLALMWFSTNYTGKVLIQCQEFYARHLDQNPPVGSSIQLQDRLMSSYEDIAEASFGKLGREVMTTILYTELIGTCALFLILQKDHVRLLLNSPMAASLPHFSDTFLLVAALAVVLPTTWLSDLAALSYVGAAGLFSAISMTGILMYYYFANPNSAPTDLIHMHSLPVTFGLLAFVFAGHAVFPAIYKGMKKDERHKFPQVLDTTYIIVAVVTVAVGFCGYAQFGNGTLEEVTLNLPPGALQIVSTLLVLVSPFAKFALTLEPVAQGVDNSFGIDPEKGRAAAGLQKRGVRTGLSVFSLFLASKVPFFGVFMSILGSFLTITVSVLFPCMAHLKLNWTSLTVRQKAIDYGILAIGSFATVMGTLTAVQSLPGLHSTSEIDLTTISQNVGMPAAQAASAAGSGLFKTLVCKSLCFTS